MNNKNTHIYTIQLQIDGTVETEKAIIKYLQQTLIDYFTQNEEIVYGVKIINKENLK